MGRKQQKNSANKDLNSVVHCNIIAATHTQKDKQCSKIRKEKFISFAKVRKNRKK
jgi:hypothetical protein